jgi:serine/threonine-protein kinase HipA
VLAVTRFDRERRADGVARRHIIDGCQALGLSSSLKYERPYGDLRDVANLREGASLPMLFRLLYQSPSPAAQRLALLRWVIFQVLIGNTDAHAKNVSFYVQPGGLVLAPAYDLVCGLAFDAEKLLDTYAMAIGDAFHPAELSPFEWANFAHACGLSFKQVSKELKTMSERVLQALPKTCAELTEARVALEIVERIKVIINRECKRQAEMAPQVAKVSAELF